MALVADTYSTHCKISNPIIGLQVCYRGMIPLLPPNQATIHTTESKQPFHVPLDLAVMWILLPTGFLKRNGPKEWSMDHVLTWGRMTNKD
jgi:hypothetical protein